MFQKTSLLLRSRALLRNLTRHNVKPRLFATLDGPTPKAVKKEVEITLIKHDGERVRVKGKVGESILDVVINNNVTLDGYGACEGTLTCSTCHVILKQEDFDNLPNKITDEEADMVELAYGYTACSRLGCQVFLDEKMDGIEINVPQVATDQRLS